MSLSQNVPQKTKELLTKRTLFVVLILLVNSLIFLYLMVDANGFNVRNVFMGSIVSTNLSGFKSSIHSITVDVFTTGIMDSADTITLQAKEFNNGTTNPLTTLIFNISQTSIKTLNILSDLTARTHPPALTKTSLQQNISDFFINNPVKNGFMELMAIFDKLMTRNKLIYFIYGGTLIGSYRHHGMVPWDDDIDVIVPKNLRRRLRHVFSPVSTDYALHFDPKCFVKLFPSHGRPIPPYAWRYPFLDVFFYGENSTHVWDACPGYTNRYSFLKSNVFPLRRRPFGDLFLLAPHDTKAVIAKTYSLDDCASNTYNHSMEHSIKGITVKCSLLHSLHPFVTRETVNGGCNETLIDQGNITNVFYESDIIC